MDKPSESSISSEIVIPFAVSQAALDQSLGAFQNVYLSSSIYATIGTVYIVAGIIGSFWSPGILSAKSTLWVQEFIGLLFMVVLLISIGILLITMSRRRVHQPVYLFQMGIIIEQSQQVQVFPWKGISEIREGITTASFQGADMGKRYSYTLRRIDGYQIEFDDQTNNIEELGSIMERAVTKAQLPLAADALRKGQTLTFQPFRMNREGIGDQREMLSLSQIQSIHVYNESVIVKKVGMVKPWKRVSIGGVPNCSVFVWLAHEMIYQESHPKSIKMAASQPRRKPRKPSKRIRREMAASQPPKKLRKPGKRIK